MKKTTAALLVLIMLCSFLVGCGSSAQPAAATPAAQEAETDTVQNDAADSIIIGTIFTSGADNEMVSALAIKDGAIVYSGDSDGVKEWIGENTEVTEIPDGELVIPGFKDGHTHVGMLKSASNMCSLSDVRTPDEYVDTLNKYVEENPDMSAYTAKGWINSAFENGCPTAEILAKVNTDKPILASSADGHSYWVNDALIELAGVSAETQDPQGGKIERYDDGTPNGCFRDTAMYIIKKALPSPSVDTYKNGILAAQDFYASVGYTSYLEIICNEQANPVNTNCAAAYEELDKAGELKLYTQGGFTVNNDDDALEVLDTAIALKDSTAGGNFELTTIKIFMDGVIEGATAYMSESYNHEETNFGQGRWLTDEDKALLVKIIEKANQAGLAVHFHAIGDQASHDAIDCVEKAYEEIGDAVLTARNVITHLQIVQSEDFERMQTLNITANVNPWCYKASGFFEETEVLYLGEERANHEYPIKAFRDSGVKMAFGTDLGGSTVYDPIESFHTLVTRTDPSDDPATTLNPEQCLSPAEVLKIMTAGTAEQFGKADTLSTLGVGMRADLVVLSQNLLTIEPNEIMNTTVSKTMSNGVWVYTK